MSNSVANPGPCEAQCKESVSLSCNYMRTLNFILLTIKETNCFEEVQISLSRIDGPSSFFFGGENTTGGKGNVCGWSGEWEVEATITCYDGDVLEIMANFSSSPSSLSITYAGLYALSDHKSPLNIEAYLSTSDGTACLLESCSNPDVTATE